MIGGIILLHCQSVCVLYSTLRSVLPLDIGFGKTILTHLNLSGKNSDPDIFVIKSHTIILVKTATKFLVVVMNGCLTCMPCIDVKCNSPNLSPI